MSEEDIILPPGQPELDLDDIRVLPNIADELSNGEIAKISVDCMEGFNDDLQSMELWMDDAEESLKLAKLITERKDHPWPGAANVKFPLLAEASIQFSAVTYPEIVRGGRVVEVTTVGDDPLGEKEQRAKRVADHMSYQLLVESNDWEEALDRMLPMLSVVGTVHKKTWFDPIKKQNVSELCNYDELIINNSVKSLKSARRVSHILHMHKNDLIERMRAGLYSDVLDEIIHSHDGSNLDEMHEIVEQHRYLDLDGDLYEEPYIVTLHRATGKVLRIVARFDEQDVERNVEGKVVRIEPIQYFTAFHFLPCPSGAYFSMGFGTLLRPLNATINTTINQLLDSGYLANMQGGFIGRGLRIQGGNLRLNPGEWKKIDAGPGADIQRNVVPLNYKEPSTVLFQLLGLMTEVGKDLSSITSIMQGEQPAQNAPATTVLALIEQGLKVFSSIHRRIYRSLKSEFEKLYRLNRLFLDPEVYFNVLDENQAILQSDYEDRSLDISPVSDPNLSSDAQRLARSRAQLDLIGMPGVNGVEIIRRFLEDLDTPNIDAILPPPDPNAPPSLEELEMQSRIQERADRANLEQAKIEVQTKKIHKELAMLEAELEKLKTESIKNIAEAEAKEAGTQIDQYKAIVDRLAAEGKLEAEKAKAEVKAAAAKPKPLEGE